MTEINRVMLIKTDVDNNNNKYYDLRLYDDGTVKAKYGRVGAPKGQSKSYSGGQVKFDKIIATKTRPENPKSKKGGYREAKVVTGSNATITDVTASTLQNIAKKQIQHTSPETTKLIEYLVKVNAHQITKASGGQLNVDAATGMIKTPLGVLTQEAIDDARSLLIELSKLRVPSKRTTAKFKSNVQNYLMLVPQVVPSKRGWLATMFPDTDSVQKQSALLDSLEATLGAIATSPQIATPDNVFNVTLTLISDKATKDKVGRLYTKTRKRMHTSFKLQPKRIFAVEIACMAAAFDSDGAKVGNVKELWHGTRASNLLSILKRGLIIPPTNAGYVTGRMYGNGVYFSDQSTKALNYAHGYWGGSYDNTCYMFLTDVAMGKEYVPSGYGDRRSLPRRGYDSTFANGGQSGVANNEMIIYRVSQCNLKFLVEFK